MVMKKLFCAIVGEEAIVPVDIDDEQSIGDLKKAIVKETAYCVDAPHKLTLYMAKENGNVQGAWMTTAHPDYDSLLRRDAVVEATYLTKDTRDAAGAIVTNGTFLDPTGSIRKYFTGVPKEDVIHVLVVVPTQSRISPLVVVPTNEDMRGVKRKAADVEDMTSTYYDSLKLDPDISRLSNFAALKEFMNSQLPVKCPIPDRTLSIVIPDVFEYQPLQRVKANAFTYAVDYEFQYFTGSENANIQMWDNFIRLPIQSMAEALQFSVQIGRNQTDASTTARTLKPDFLLWMNNCLVLKGEEKGAESDFEIATKELMSKMKKMHVTLFGSVPFLFAYAAANSWVQFFAIDRSMNIQPITTKLHLITTTNRVQCVVYSLHICRILHRYVPLLPTGIMPLYQQVIRNNGKITLYEDHVVKRLEHVPAQLDDILAIYDAINKGLIPCTIQCIGFNRQKLKFRLSPVGYSMQPSSDNELIIALICIARALQGLHAQGFVHRDIRWPNILCLGNNAFILIDFENAGLDGASIPAEFLSSRFLDPLVMSDVNHIYRSCHDMYQFGKLIQISANKALMYLKANLSSSNVQERFTAAKVLEYLLCLRGQIS